MITPKTIDIYITDKCDLKCNMCNIGINNRLKDNNKLPIGRTTEDTTQDTISIEDCENIIEQISTMEPKPSVYISGGEPFLQKEKVLTLLKEAQAKQIDVGMNSNATYLNETLINSLVDYELKGITLSLDGTKDIHNHIRGSNKSYDNVFNAIKTFEKVKKEKNANFPKVFILMAITPDNYHEIDQVKELADSLPIDAITFSHYVYTSSEQILEHREVENLNPHINKPLNTIGGIYSQSLQNMDFNKFFENIEKITQGEKQNFSFSPNLKTKEELVTYYTKPLEIMDQSFEPHCKWVNDRLDINSDGTILFGYPCFQVQLGSIKNKDNLLEIFNNDPIKEIRSYLNKNHNLPACRRCCGNRKK